MFPDRNSVFRTADGVQWNAKRALYFGTEFISARRPSLGGQVQAQYPALSPHDLSAEISPMLMTPVCL